MTRVKDLVPRNSKGQPHGYWEVYWSSDKLWFKCIYHDGKEIGYEELYDYFGELLIKRYYL